MTWLLGQLSADPTLRVLWVADQQELVDQASKTFVELAPTMPAGVERSLRAIHGGANLVSALGDEDLDVACTTRQSLLGRGFDQASRRRLTQFLRRPTIVVVDEAHHAVAPTYRRMLQHVQQQAPSTMVIGLTATPWPTGYGMTALLEEMFPARVSDVSVRDLILDGVLARPVFHTVETGQQVSLSADELKQLVNRDVPSSVLRRLDRNRRNDVIVRSWLQRPEEWGKTLVFACDIQHADNLANAFADEGVPTTVVHSESEARRAETLEAFRNTDQPSVLISVGMLLEGVDVPDARTAFLTRPTKSRILMRQMIGRVLRGPSSGGDELAHVVDMRDRWTEDVDILAPVDIPISHGVRTGDDESPADHTLPPVIDELTDEPLGEDVLRRIERAYREVVTAVPHSAAITKTQLVGYYDLDALNVPVFDHVKDRWEELFTYEVDGKRSPVRSAVELFEDLPVPRPCRSDVEAVVDYCRSRHFAPPLMEVRTTFSVRDMATRLLEAGAMTEHEKVQWLRRLYESTLARSAFFSFQAFFEAVQQEVLSISGVTDNIADPESPSPRPLSKPALPKLTKRPTRDLQPLFRSAVMQGRDLLQTETENYASLLNRENLPRIYWTRRPVRSTFAYWTTRLGGRRRGVAEIRVNRWLQAPKSQVSDELLEYLIWHELCHHLLPGRGHDAEFRRLESLWPDFARLDHELDTLHEQYDFV